MKEPIRVLAVDDNPMNLLLLEDILSDDFEFKAVESGEEAIDVAPDFRPDVVLLDIMMPGMDGYETCRLLRQHPILFSTKVIMVSAKVMTNDRLKGYDAGADDYVVKPFDDDEIIAKIHVFSRLKTMEELDRLKSDLLLFLSHETRTPLNGIIAPVQMVLENDLDLAERTELLEMVQLSANRLHRFIETFTLLSEMETGMWNFKLTQIDLCQIIPVALQAVAARYTDKEVRFVEKLPPSAKVSADLTQITRAIEILIDNAIKYGPDNGQVAVQVVADDSGFDFIVSDEGKGIDPDIHKFLFHDASSLSLTQRPDGHGLSLSLAHCILRAHGGDMSVRNIETAGAEFRMRVPKYRPDDLIAGRTPGQACGLQRTSG